MRYLPVNSERAPSRHMHNTAYGCLIPHLTRFTGMHCARPARQHHLTGTFIKSITLNKDITLAIADCKYRAPLPPRLYDLYIILQNFRNIKKKIVFTLTLYILIKYSRYHMANMFNFISMKNMYLSRLKHLNISCLTHPSDKKYM